MKAMEDIKQTSPRNNIIFILFIVMSFMVVLLCMGTAYFKFSFMSVILIGVAVACISAMCLIISNFYVIPLLFLISAILNIVVFGSITDVIFSLSIYPAGFIFYILYYKKTPRTKILILLSMFYALLFALWFIADIVAETNSFSLNLLFDTIKNEIEIAVELARSVLINTLYSETIEDMPSDTVENLLRNMKLTLQLFVPAFFILLCNFVSYVITGLSGILFRLFYKITEIRRFSITESSWRISLSVISAVIFPLTILMNMFSSETSNITYLFVINNINMILCPPFFIIGIYFTFDHIKKNFESNKGKYLTVLIFGMVTFLFLYTVWFYYLITAGLISTMKKPVKNLLEKIKSNFTGDDDDDFE